jgi:acyl transferase domain-containing protein/NADPH:quinone reductase-like Zn-dependent oxidoreductase/acyl carrier protein/SAM-dependent methyltransferase
VLSGLVQANHSEVRVSEGKQGTGSASGAQLVTLPSLREHQPDWQQMLTSLGALYVRGATLDWLALDQGSALTPRRKVALPTYPFQRQRYWMDGAPPATAQTEASDGFVQWFFSKDVEQLTDRIADRGAFAAQERAIVAKVLATLAAEQRSQQRAAEVAALLYEVQWERQPRPQQFMPAATPGRWLVLADTQGVSQALAAQLLALGEQVDLIATPAALFEATEQGATEQGADNRAPLRGVIHLWSLDDRLPATLPDLLASQERNLGSVLHLVRAAALFRQAAPRLWIATDGAQSLDLLEPVSVTQSPLWGMGRVITLEHSELWGGLVDLDRAATPAVRAQSLLAEIWPPAPSRATSEDCTGEEQVAYRQGNRYVARLVPAQPVPSATRGTIRPDGLYLVTGGLGGLGLQTVNWLANAGARHLLILSRRGLQTKQQQATVAALQAQGVAVTVASVDVADETAMRALFDQIASGPVPLRGVIHAAGVGGFQALRSLQWTDFVAMLQPKVIGGWLLHSLTVAHALDFFVSYASGAGIWGGKQQAHYAAANHFLDGLMAYRRSQGLPGLSIAWGPWAGTGMASPEAQALFLAMGVRAFAPETGLAIQAHLLETTACQVTAASIDWARFKPLYELTKPRRFLAQIPVAQHQAEDKPTVTLPILTELQTLAAMRRFEHLRSYVQRTAGHVLGMTTLPDPTVGFADLGMDSLMALEVKRQLEQALQQTLPATVALEYPTVDALTTYLLERLHLGAPDGAPASDSTARQFSPTPCPPGQSTEPIAIISMACRFPGADTPEAFWQVLQAGMDMVREVPADRWPVADFYATQRPTPGKMYTREAAFLENVAFFDPLFFGIAPREATGIDPQQRLLLEVGWEAIERAGLAQSTLVDSATGVFIGIGRGDYEEATGGIQSVADLDTHVITSNGSSVAAGRLAYTFGLQGPTIAVDTACSSSLVALHLACQSLRMGECDLALAGGVNLILAPFTHIALSQMGALSVDGRCKSFDAAADGFGRGEGCGVVLLKRLSTAERDGDTILAVVKGSAVNHDGPSSGLTVPNKRAQEKLLRQALANAGATADQVAYVEAHGTGTALGDPIEIRALGAVFGAERATPLLVGSVKSNVAHLEAAAGIAGIIKTVLALHHGQIPPHLHFTHPNPYIEWEDVAIAVPTTLQPWPSSPPGQPLMAGVSAFGISGTNAHVVLASADRTTADKEGAAGEGSLPFARQTGASSERRCYVLPLSAKNSAALPALAARYGDYLQVHPTVALADLCDAAAVGRNHFAHRLAIVAADWEELQMHLAAVSNGTTPLERAEEHLDRPMGRVAQGTPRLAFLFTGQGSQYVQMGRQFYETEARFRAILERCEGVAQQSLGRSLLALLYPPTEPLHNDLMESHPCGQAANFAVQCALVEVWKAWGIQPDLVLGHSLGDFAAAYAAGVLSLEDGLRLVIERGRLMEQAVGSMVAIMGSEADVAPFVAPYADVVIGVVNGPRSVVISGGPDHVQAATRALEAAGFKTRKVAVPMAAHSPLLDPVLDAFEHFIRQQITLHPPKRPVVSSMTGALVTDELTDPAYWRHHLRNTVRFADGVATLAAEGITIFIEIGPKATLLGMLEPILEAAEAETAEVPNRAQGDPTQRIYPLFLASLRQNEEDWRQMMRNLGQLYVHGVNLHGEEKTGQRRKVLLPTYPFQRERCWMDVPKRKTTATLRPLIDKLTLLPLHQEIVGEREFSLASLPFLADHRLYDTAVAPGACQLAMALSAAELTFHPQRPFPLILEDIILPQPLVLYEEQARTVQAILTETKKTNGSGLCYEFKIVSFDLTADVIEPLTHATGVLFAGTADRVEAVADIRALQARCPQAMDIPAFYATAASGGLLLGPTFRWLENVWCGQQDGMVETVGKLTLPAVLGATTGYLLHPGLLDGCFQVASLAQDNAAQEGMLLPFAVERLQIYQPMTGTQWWCHAIQSAAKPDTPSKTWDIALWDEQGAPVAFLKGFTLRAASTERAQSTDRWREWLYQITWQPRPYFGLAPDYLSTPATLAAHLRAQAAMQPAPDEAASHALYHALETVSIAYVVATFGKAGFLFQPGAEWRTEQIAQKLGVIPSYHRLLERLLGMLVEAGIVRCQADGWQVVRTPESASPTQMMRTLQATYGATSELRLLARCGAALHEVLLGVQEPLELLFPEGNVTTAAEQHRSTAGASAVNRLIYQIVQDAVAHLPAERGMRIVEIGAGTGGTTAGLLPLLAPDRTEYLFTDIGPTFLHQARERFADYSFVRYQPLDIERSPVLQGFAPQQADLVIAANVLHATRDLAETLAHVRQLLQPGGQLLLIEATTPSRWVDLTFGLTTGWWRFADQRQGHPLLTAAQWQALLLGHGFQVVETMEQGGQAVLIAQTLPALVEANVQPLAATSAANSDLWLLLADTQGIAAEIATQLRQQGATPLLVYPGERYEEVNAHTFAIDRERAEDYQRLLTACGTLANRPLRGVIHLWSVEITVAGHETDLTIAVQKIYNTTLHLLQALLKQQLEAAGLWLVTRDAQAVSVGEGVGGVLQSGLWGMGRTLALEHPEFRCVQIDLDSTLALAQQAAMLWAEIRATAYNVEPSAQPIEEQVALRRNARCVARLARYAPPPGLPLPDGPYRLAIAERGGLDNICLQPTTRQAPAAGEVEIRVHASGLNFLDVLDVLGILPFDRALLGGECAGEIVQVGAEVTGFQVGDRVAALTAGAFSQYVTVLSDLVVKLPPMLTFEQAAGIPSNFLTAHYALHRMAKIQPGDKILIHAAAGGTGMAAIQIAQAAGAEIYATASPGKWPTLQSLGIIHLYNSRTLAFADQILADTDGQGVNIVLNSLTGAGFMEKNLAVLAKGGHFLELAKRDIWQADAVYSTRADIHYHFVDLITVAKEEPAWIRTQLATLMAHFADGTLYPLPQTAFAIQEAVAAFRYMQQAKHIGKIVLTAPVGESPLVKTDATYLITGGLGGLGLAVAAWLAEQGARHLLLVGRRTPHAEIQPQLERLTALGVTLTVAQADVTDRTQLQQVLQQVDSRYPLRGVIHSVGVLDDGPLVQQTWPRFRRVLAPKLQGSWHLHELTKALPVDFFVLFSSMTGLLGNRGQANHAAANAFLDAFVHYRRARGLPALSIQWGGWSEIGAAADLVRENRQWMAARGQGAIAPQQGIAAFAYLLAQNQEQRATQVGVMPIQWPQFLANVAATNLFYHDFRQADLTTPLPAVTEPVANLRHQLKAADADSRQQLLADYLRATVAKVLGLRDPKQIHPHQGLLEMGLDSLMAIELRNQMGRTLEQKLPSTLIFDYPTLAELHQYLLRTLFAGETLPAANLVSEQLSTAPAPDLVAKEIAELSVDELMAQIAEDFKSFQ